MGNSKLENLFVENMRSVQCTPYRLMCHPHSSTKYCSGIDFKFFYFSIIFERSRQPLQPLQCILFDHSDNLVCSKMDLNVVEFRLHLTELVSNREPAIEKCFRDGDLYI